MQCIFLTSLAYTKTCHCRLLFKLSRLDDSKKCLVWPTPRNSQFYLCFGNLHWLKTFFCTNGEQVVKIFLKEYKCKEPKAWYIGSCSSFAEHFGNEGLLSSFVHFFYKGLSIFCLYLYLISFWVLIHMYFPWVLQRLSD